MLRMHNATRQVSPPPLLELAELGHRARGLSREAGLAACRLGHDASAMLPTRAPVRCPHGAHRFDAEPPIARGGERTSPPQCAACALRTASAKPLEAGLDNTPRPGRARAGHRPGKRLYLGNERLARYYLSDRILWM